MNILSVQNLTKSVDDKILFKNVSLGVEDGDKIGIVGHNGAGKSTFLKVLNGLLSYDEGIISYNNNTEVLMLDQNIKIEPNTTLLDFLYLQKSKKIQILKEYNNAIKIENDKQYNHLLSLCEKEEVWNIEADYKAYLTELNLNFDLSMKMDKFSGGEIKKVAIARILALKPGLLLLDEITNHLDITSIEYLEKYLQNTKTSLIVVSHDRYLINSVCNTIWEVNNENVYTHPGSYDEYLERKAIRLDIMQNEQNRLASILRRELKWLARGPQARTGKDKNRKDRIQAMLESQQDVEEKKQNTFSTLEKRLGKKILELNNISHSFNNKVLFKNFTYSFKKGDKIGILGSNGSGKTTLLNILTGMINPTEGSVDIGLNTSFAYYDQLSLKLDESKTALEIIEDIASRIFIGTGEVNASKFLELFGFPLKRQRTAVNVFSGGEKRRLYLLSKLASNPNFLILDEPTNDLDIKTMENLEEYITNFSGCSLIVSHDRAFLDITCDYLFIFRDNEIKLFPGSFSLYKKQLIPEVKKNIKESIEKREKEKVRKLSFKEQKEYENLELEIENLENFIEKLEMSFSLAEDTEDGSLQERSQKYEQSKLLLEEKTERYFYLAEIETASKI